MCMPKYNPPELLPYLPHDRENALRLAAQERFDMMMAGQRRNKTDRRTLK